MSQTPIIAPSTSSLERTSFTRHIPRLTAQARALLTAVNLHYAGVAALLIINLYLAAHLFFTMQALKAAGDDAQAQQRITLRAAEIAAQPLRGIDVKIANSTADADEFSNTRLPYAYSQVASELGSLTKKHAVCLTRVQYAQSPALSGRGALTEVRMDASLSGDYRGLVGFINSLERDKTFFDINGITFTGAQSGAVNLRMRLTTYLRAPIGDEQSDEMPATPPDPNAPAVPGGPQ